MARHLALNYIRDSRREVVLDEGVFDSAQVPLPFASDIDLMADSAKVHRCLEQLEPSRKLCILHAYVDGCSHAEIAGLLNTPLGTVKAWIKRSLKALRECMG